MKEQIESNFKLLMDFLSKSPVKIPMTSATEAFILDVIVRDRLTYSDERVVVSLATNSNNTYDLVFE